MVQEPLATVSSAQRAPQPSTEGMTCSPSLEASFLRALQSFSLHAAGRTRFGEGGEVFRVSEPIPVLLRNPRCHRVNHSH